MSKQEQQEQGVGASPQADDLRARLQVNTPNYCPACGKPAQVEEQNGKRTFTLSGAAPCATLFTTSRPTTWMKRSRNLLSTSTTKRA